MPAAKRHSGGWISNTPRPGATAARRVSTCSSRTSWEVRRHNPSRPDGPWPKFSPISVPVPPTCPSHLLGRPARYGRPHLPRRRGGVPRRARPVRSARQPEMVAAGSEPPRPLPLVGQQHDVVHGTLLQNTARLQQVPRGLDGPRHRPVDLSPAGLPAALGTLERRNPCTENTPRARMGDWHHGWHRPALRPFRTEDVRFLRSGRLPAALQYRRPLRLQRSPGRVSSPITYRTP